MIYRLYIDEVGTSDMNHALNPAHQYLSLTGLIFELAYVSTSVFPAIEALKQKFFDSHPDEPIILHRKEIAQKNYPFANLRDPEKVADFDRELLELLEHLDYVVISAVIDKIEHQQRYQVWRFDPYHYCLTVIVERYVRWLTLHDATGDVMAESRGGAAPKRCISSDTRERYRVRSARYYASSVGQPRTESQGEGKQHRWVAAYRPHCTPKLSIHESAP